MAISKQLPLRELLSDPIFLAWTKKKPEVKVNGHTEPWRVYVKLEGKGWARKDFVTYAQAFNWLASKLSAVEDAAIHSKRQEFKPPVVKFQGKRVYWPMPPGHEWCRFCRRPTRFGFFRRHHALPDYLCVPYERRCTICGARFNPKKRFRSKLRSRFDAD